MHGLAFCSVCLSSVFCLLDCFKCLGHTYIIQVDIVDFLPQRSSHLYILELRVRISVGATTQATIDSHYCIALGELTKYV